MKNKVLFISGQYYKNNDVGIKTLYRAKDVSVDCGHSHLLISLLTYNVVIFIILATGIDNYCYTRLSARLLVYGTR